MAVRTKIEPIERDVRIIIDDLLSPEAQSAAFAGFARTHLAEAERVNAAALGFVPPHEQYVDGRRGAVLETVRPDGVIIFEFELLPDIFAWIGKALVEASPRKTGKYSESHLFLADGVVVPPGAAAPQASEYVFVNSQPYARKIDRGLSNQAPDGVYQAVAVLARQRFGNIAMISFGYEALQTGAIHDWAGSARGAAWARRHRRKRDAAQWLRKQPAIFIRSH
ncbi:hypothetical protein SAMN02745157_1464 [Kaistia soli DSM 19436]|uniref:Uncharacterized protein n=1 Tax=Kaistia soli DSM 19436 TaxID=1122133 RepID=A0A1M4YA27_9HYPH|nr:hypothetical protein [Kaistia soli]SHF02493.1 hypothetical protein SAMN02745157_1464 [Kaistia soli DSM 19436]